MCNGRIVGLSALERTERLELIKIKVRSVVSDYTVRNPISEYQLSDEADRIADIKILDGFGFNPFSELVDCYKHMGEATPASPQRSDHI